MLRRDAIALLLAAAPAPRRAVFLLDIRTRRALAARNSELLAPPGSTLKPLVFSTLLRARKLDPGEAFPRTGRLAINGRRFDCSHPQINTAIDLRTALAYSCNGFTAHVAERSNRESWRAGSNDSKSAGHRPRPRVRRANCRHSARSACWVNPMELAQAYRRIALGGEPAIVGGLKDAVEFGTAQRAAVPGLAVAGKTGSVLTVAAFDVATRSPPIIVILIRSSYSSVARVLITGCTGQDGSYLADFLLAKGYEVHGLKRRASSLNTDRLDHIYRDVHEAGARFFLHYADLTDGTSLATLLYDIRPDEIYNLGAQSHVKVSFEIPEFTADVVASGTLRLLEAMRRTGVKCRFYQASSSEMFGSAPPPQNETTPFHPRSPYACAKAFGHHIAVNYRESYGLHVSSGILFNHESPRRGETFVTRKITRAVAHIKHGLQHKLYLGNLDARRDWGYAPDYVRAMWLMLQQETADDFVVGTGEAHTVREFVELAFAHAGLDWKEHVEVDSRYFRPAEVDYLCADASKARNVLGWEPSVAFPELVRIMVEADMKDTEARINGGAEALRSRVALQGGQS